MNEVREWFFEVWNEPNLKEFWTGTQADYFKLYRYTVEAIKGGPGASSRRPGDRQERMDRRVPGLLREEESAGRFRQRTHHYPTDAFGAEGDDTVTQLANSQRSILREQAQDTCRRARGA